MITNINIFKKSINESKINESNTLPDGMVVALDDIDETRPNRMKKPPTDPGTSSFAGRGGVEGLVYIQDEAESVMQDKYGGQRGTRLWQSSIGEGARGGAMFAMANEVMKEKEYLLDIIGSGIGRNYFDISYYSLWKAWMNKIGVPYKVDTPEELQAKKQVKIDAENNRIQIEKDTKNAAIKKQFDDRVTDLKFKYKDLDLDNVKPDAKDVERIISLVKKDVATMSRNMANSIKDKNKAVKRGVALLNYIIDNNMEIYYLNNVEIFFRRAQELSRSNESMNDVGEDLYHDIDWVELEKVVKPYIVAMCEGNSEYEIYQNTFDKMKEEIIKYKMTN
jgi:hypothetical protein